MGGEPASHLPLDFREMLVGQAPPGRRQSQRGQVLEEDLAPDDGLVGVVVEPVDDEQGEMRRQLVGRPLGPSRDDPHDGLRQRAPEAVAGGVPGSVGSQPRQWDACRQAFCEGEIGAVREGHVDDRHITPGTDVGRDRSGELVDIPPHRVHLPPCHAHRHVSDAVGSADR